METNNLTSIVILFRDGEKEYGMLKRCLKSIKTNTSQIKTPFEIILVANGTKEKLDEVKELHNAKHVDELIICSSNTGFPKGNNLGVEAAKGKYVVLLNDDTIVTKGWLEKMEVILDGDKKVGAVGPYTNFCSGDQCVQMPHVKSVEDIYACAQKFRGVERFIESKLVFFCVMTRKELYDKYKLWEGYGLGNFEDDDYCWRLRNDGYRLKIANTFIYHVGGQNYSPNPNYVFLLAQNQKLFMERTGMYKKIALCMIVGQDEDQKVLERAIKSVNMCVDNLNIVLNYKNKPNNNKLNVLKTVINNFSTDKRTRYVVHKWTDFSDMRNTSIDIDGNDSDYIFWIDCDDIVLNPLDIRAYIMSKPDVDAFGCKVLSRTESGTVEEILQHRLIKNKKCFRFRNRVHEDLSFSLLENDAKREVANIHIEHTGYTDPKVWEKKNERNMKILMEEMKDNPHSLIYYSLINCILIKKWSKRERAKKLQWGIDLCVECIEKLNLTKEDPLTPKMWVLKGALCVRLGQPIAAKQSFHLAHDIWKHPEGTVSLAELYFSEKNYAECHRILLPMYKQKNFQITNIPVDLVLCEKQMLKMLGDCAYESFLFKRRVAKVKRSDQKETYDTTEQKKDAYIENMDEKELLQFAEKVYSEYLTIQKDLYVIDKLASVLRYMGREDLASFMTIKVVNEVPSYAQGWANLGAFEIKNKRYITAFLFYKEAMRYAQKDKMIRHNYKTLKQMMRK